MSFKSLCEKYFGSSNFYEVLGLDSKATNKDVKKAYHRLSLLVHPDRVDEEHKQVATEKFKVLGKIHSILQDSDKRKLYDDVGEFDEEMDASYNWMDYWRNMFKKIEIEDIKNYEKQYIGSDTELRDIKRAYVSCKGDMNKILEMVPFSSCDSEPRIIQIVQKMVDNGEVENFKAFFHENKQRKLRRQKKWEKERKMAESIDMKEIERDMEINMKKRAESFENFMSNLEEKYTPKNKKLKSITNGPHKKNQRK